ncbi:54S ribosomal protein L8, mitochondrial [Malassezia psittaci]|uniref:54S ribosomal protein L8, mitochondrial n=1 Tax=Malassezia psittaci TaxID=1821823 RepID=A0AAF0FB37_9BASI|nr:54S ribosomal protein L8, mitochondrial [Malassezia psittaci]
MTLGQSIGHERIVTTVAKAKEAARQAEKIITLGKNGTPTALSSAQSYLFSTGDSLPRLAQLAKRYEQRPGGYTRVHLMGYRKGDHAPRAILELVDNPTDVKLDITARTMAREADIMLRRAQTQLSLPDIAQLLQAQSSVPLESDSRFAPMTRRNIAKLVKYRGDEARKQLIEKASYYLEQIRASDQVIGLRREDTARWDDMQLTRPSRGRILTKPKVGDSLYAGQLLAEDAARIGRREVRNEPIRGKAGKVSPRRTVTLTKPSVIRLSKGVYAKRYVRGERPTATTSKN